MATDIRLKEELPAITDQLVETYTECSRLNHLAHEPLPSRDAVGEIVADLYEVLFPGYGRRSTRTRKRSISNRTPAINARVPVSHCGMPSPKSRFSAKTMRNRATKIWAMVGGGCLKGPGRRRDGSGKSRRSPLLPSF